jgi:hypothetical protein
MLNRFKIAVIIICLGARLMLAPAFVTAQYRDTVHDTNTQYEFTFSYNWDHTFLTSISVLQDSNLTLYGWNYIQFKQYDDHFNIFNEKRYYDSLNTFSCRDMAYHNSAYYLSGLKYNSSSDTIKGILIKFDTIGNVIWEKNYFTNDKDVRLASVTSRPDGNIIILGNNINQAQPQLGFTFVSLLDTSGSVIWTKTYNQVYSQQPISYKNTDDGGGILATTHQINNTNYQRTAIYKLDANGNTQWQKILGYQAPFPGPTIYSSSYVTPMPDGNYLCHGVKSDYIDGNKNSWLVKLSPTGVVLIDTVYSFSNGFDTFTGAEGIIFTEGGFYISGSAYDDFNASYSKFYYCYFDNNLNMQWRRLYWKREAENAMVFQKLLNNGFIAMAGTVFQDSQTNTVDEWFMVVDSMGCETEICAQSIGVSELRPSFFNVSIYPNPAQDEVYLALDEVQYSNLNYILVDISGKIVMRGTTQMRNAVDISQLPNGYYVVQIVVEGSIISKPLIISR